VLAAPVFYCRAVINDFARLLRGRRDLGLRAWQVPLAALLYQVAGLSISRASSVP